MGNQGMTNWKFSAFFAIALMLIAGMVSTAMAADGDGTVTINWAPDDDAGAGTSGEVDKIEPQDVTDAAAGSTAVPLPSGSVENSVELRYTLDATGAAIDMNGGAVKIEIPSGFTVSKGLVTVTDDADVIYDTDRAAKVDTAAGDPQDGDNALDPLERGRVKILPVSGSNVSSIEVSLDAEWNLASGTRVLAIQFDLVTAAVPSSLPFTNDNANARRYNEYRFTTSSKEKDGTLTRLKATSDNPEPQPYVWVGNAAAGTGTATATPTAAFEGESGVDFRIVYTAVGTMYNSKIRVTIPASLVAPDDTEDARTHDEEFTALITISQRGGVNFGDANGTAAGSPVYVADAANGTIDISIDNLNKDDDVRIFYENITVQTLTAEEQITVGTDTDENGTDAFIQVGDPIGSVKPLLGSGEVTLNPAAVEVNSVRDYTVTYKALTKLEDVWLVVDLPDTAFVDEDGSRVNTFTNDRVDNDGALNYAYIPTADDQTLTTDSQAVIWKIASLGKGSTFRRTIKRLRATSDAGAYTWEARLVLTDPGTAEPSDGDVGVTLYVLQAGSDPDNPDVTFDITSTIPSDTVRGEGYPAASEQTIMFEFVAANTPIKDGNVSFRIPSGWTRPNETADAAGQVTVQTDADAAGTGADPADLDAKHVSTSSTEITVNLETLPENGRVIVTYSKGIIQHNAQEEVEIRGYFKSGASLPERVSEIVVVDVTNVAHGSGTVTIGPTSVEAGSTDNDMTVRFTAEGSMDGGQVRLELPAGWGSLQETNASGVNYASVRISGGTLRDTAIGDDRVIAQLDEFGKGDVLTISFSDLEAQADLGIARFVVWSAGTRGEDVARVKGIARPDDADTDIELLGNVYVDNDEDADNDGTADTPEAPNPVANNDGLLRVEVGGGGDGSGKATVEIAGSKAGPAQYDVTADDGTVSTQVIEQVHAGDDETHLRFVYIPIETIGDGELQFTVSAGWSAPQADSSRQAGFTNVTSTGSIGAVTFSGASLNVPIYSLDKGGTVTINYGTSDGGAVAPTRTGKSAFDIKIKGSEGGSLVSLSSGNMEQVTVRPQASGAGTASVDTDGDVHSGDTGRTITITYTSIGQIVGGRLKVTVPDGDDWPDAMAASIDVSSGSATYGGDLSETALADNEDIGGVNDLVISNISLGAGQSLTITYATDIAAKAGDFAFKVGFDGSHGPDEGFIALPDLSVTVMDARAGSGEVMIDQMGEVVAGSTGNEITITYTVQGQISELREFKVRVPAGWSPPIDDAAAADKMGTYIVTHSRLNDDGEYAEITDDVEKQAPAKANEDDEAASYMVARVISERTVEQGDKIMFTYQNAMAPATPEKSTFRFFFDGTQVTPDLNVIVQSAEGASALGLEAADSFIIDDGGSLMVTVKLMAADGSVATMNANTVVTLTASSGTITSSVTISAGDYEAEATLTADEPGNITITAAATGLEGAELMVMANTDNVSIDSVTVSPMYASTGTSVTVSATGTPAQEGTFSATNAAGMGVSGRPLTEDESGSYTGMFDVVVDHFPDGAYDVTVSINGTSSTATGALTIDNVEPGWQGFSVRSNGNLVDTVANGDTVTIFAGVTDVLSGIASVMVDVGALDSTQAQGRVELMVGDDGSYSADVTISEDNERPNGAKTVAAAATDMAGNISRAGYSVTLNNEISFTSTLPAGISLFHVPLSEEGLSTVGDLEEKLGDNVNLLITYDGTSWNSRSSDVMLTADLGILVSMAAETTVTFTGHAWGAGDSMINLRAGSNLVGLPVNDDRVTNISDIIGLFDEGVVSSIIVSSGGEFQLVAAAGDAADGPVAGDAAYLVIASAAGSAMVSGAGWMNGEMAGAAPIALAGYTVDNQTPVLDVHGSVVDEITGLVKEGFRVKVKNVSTKAALSSVISAEATDGYNITFVDLADSYAARVGDVLEITADSPDPLVGVKPVRHIVTVDDVKNSTIQLENLIAYEIPAETELLRNYPNPFNPETWIPYRLAEDADVSLTIYDAYGSLVRSIDIGHQIAAVYDTRAKAIYWDGRNQFGEQVASGLYFYHLSAGDFSGTRRMVILK